MLLATFWFILSKNSFIICFLIKHIIVQDIEKQIETQMIAEAKVNSPALQQMGQYLKHFSCMHLLLLINFV